MKVETWTKVGTLAACMAIVFTFWDLSNRNMDRISSNIGDLKHDVSESISTLRNDMNSQFNKIDERFGKWDTKLDEVNFNSVNRDEELHKEILEVFQNQKPQTFIDPTTVTNNNSNTIK
jgi:hypothetical protein